MAPFGLPFAVLLPMAYAIVPCLLASLVFGPIARAIYSTKSERNVRWMKWLLSVAVFVAAIAIVRDEDRAFPFLIVVAPLFFYPLTALLVLDDIVRTKARAAAAGESD